MNQAPPWRNQIAYVRWSDVTAFSLIARRAGRFRLKLKKRRPDRPDWLGDSVKAIILCAPDQAAALSYRIEQWCGFPPAGSRKSPPDTL